MIQPNFNDCAIDSSHSHFPLSSIDIYTVYGTLREFSGLESFELSCEERSRIRAVPNPIAPSPILLYPAQFPHLSFLNEAQTGMRGALMYLSVKEILRLKKSKILSF
jgi:hypothetical protein